MTDDAERIIGLRKRIEEATRSVARLEAAAEAARERSRQARQKLAELGYTDDGDVEATIRGEVAEVESALYIIEREIEELKDATRPVG